MSITRPGARGRAVAVCGLAILCFCECWGACVEPAVADDLVRVPPGGWRVTRGALVPTGGAREAVREPTFRGVAPNSDGEAGELRFVYLGPTEHTAPLASGEVRRQIGLKLRAQDGCNLLYVMWRIEPRGELVVSLKRNPGQSTHDECGAHGYVDLSPALAAEPPLLVAGEEHTLRARLTGRMLSVWTDGRLVWRGDVGADASTIDGPAGARSDNGAFYLELRARPTAGATPIAPPDGGDEE